MIIFWYLILVYTCREWGKWYLDTVTVMIYYYYNFQYYFILHNLIYLLIFMDILISSLCACVVWPTALVSFSSEYFSLMLIIQCFGIKTLQYFFIPTAPLWIMMNKSSHGHCASRGAWKQPLHATPMTSWPRFAR